MLVYKVELLKKIERCPWQYKKDIVCCEILLSKFLTLTNNYMIINHLLFKRVLPREYKDTVYVTERGQDLVLCRIADNMPLLLIENGDLLRATCNFIDHKPLL